MDDAQFVRQGSLWLSPSDARMQFSISGTGRYVTAMTRNQASSAATSTLRQPTADSCSSPVSQHGSAPCSGAQNPNPEDHQLQVGGKELWEE